jgi:hypothetical protein
MESQMSFRIRLAAAHLARARIKFTTIPRSVDFVPRSIELSHGLAMVFSDRFE